MFLLSVDFIDIICDRFSVCSWEFPQPLITETLIKLQAKKNPKTKQVVMNFSVTSVSDAVPTLYPCIHNTVMPSILEFEVDTIWWSETEARCV